MLTNLKKNKDGFTIIEVMIVLAIAGLIILVVLLAIPALQRNSRNTTIKNDASAIAGAVGEFSSANNGKTPTTISNTDGKIAVTKTGATEVNGKMQGGTVVTAGATVPSVAGTINYVVGKKCNTEGTAVDTGASGRSVALLFNLETSSALAPQCLDA
jgi:prepilin-type N-terminal cleavage/methylation domain-containing protein